MYAIRNAHFVQVSSDSPV